MEFLRNTHHNCREGLCQHTTAQLGKHEFFSTSSVSYDPSYVGARGIKKEAETRLQSICLQISYFGLTDYYFDNNKLQKILEVLVLFYHTALCTSR